MAESLFTRPTEGFLIFRDYEGGKYIFRDQCHALICYLIGNAQSYYSPNRSYYQDWLDESNDFQIVIRWRERHALQGMGKYGERICYKNDKDHGELIDLTKPEFKHHKKDSYCNCNKLEAIRLCYD